MNLASSFETFLQDIRPTATQRQAMRRAHRALRERLLADPQINTRIISTFLQGSYRRATAIRNAAGQQSDVDVVVVTSIPRTTEASDAQALFYGFVERHYPDKWRPQGRSIGITLSDVELDLVITSAPSETQTEAVKAAGALDYSDFMAQNEERAYSGLDLSSTLLMEAKQAQWKLEPLYIPNRDLGSWDPTHPLAQIAWTQEMNGLTQGHYVNVIKALKWWRRNHPVLTGHPKGYPLEHLIGQCCPPNITSVAEGIRLSLAKMVSDYGAVAQAGCVPVLPDHGVPNHNVLGRVTVPEFQLFMVEVAKAAVIAADACSAQTPKASADKWRELLGTRFPESTSTVAAGLLSSSAVTASTTGFPDTGIKPGGPKRYA